jgi:hypothetical protein
MGTLVQPYESAATQRSIGQVRANIKTNPTGKRFNQCDIGLTPFIRTSSFRSLRAYLTGLLPAPLRRVHSASRLVARPRRRRDDLTVREMPFVVDGARFLRSFGAKTTPLDEAVRTTLDWYRSTRALAPRAGDRGDQAGVSGAAATWGGVSTATTTAKPARKRARDRPRTVAAASASSHSTSAGHGRRQQPEPRPPTAHRIGQGSARNGVRRRPDSSALAEATVGGQLGEIHRQRVANRA